jgi:hypothetical protein
MDREEKMDALVSRSAGLVSQDDAGRNTAVDFFEDDISHADCRILNLLEAVAENVELVVV